MREFVERLRRPPAWFKALVTGICAVILLALVVNLFTSDPYTGPWLWVALVFALVSGAFGWTSRLPSLRGRKDDDDDQDDDQDNDVSSRKGSGPSGTR